MDGDVPKYDSREPGKDLNTSEHEKRGLDLNSDPEISKTAGEAKLSKADRASERSRSKRSQHDHDNSR